MLNASFHFMTVYYRGYEAENESAYFF